MKNLIVLLPLLASFAACNQSAGGDPSEIVARSAAWDAALNAKDIDAIADLYTADARIMAPNTAIATGREAVRDEFGGMIDAGLNVKLTSIEAAVSGDMAYNVGTYLLSAGGETLDVGKFVEIWERGDDGLWRIANDIYNSDNPPGSAAMPETHLMIAHEVDDVEHWLAAWRGENSRHKLFRENGAAHVHTFVSPENPNLTGLAIAVNDIDALGAMLESEEGQAAAAADGVRSDTIVIMTEAK